MILEFLSMTCLASLITAWAASNVLGQTDFVSNNCSGGPAALCYPQGLSFDSTDDVLFVAATSNGLILDYDMSGIITNDMNATYDIANANSYDVYYDAADQYLFSADSTTNSEQIYDLSAGLGNYESLTWALATNLTNSVVDGATTTSTDMNDPEDVVYDAAAKLLFVAERSIAVY